MELWGYEHEEKRLSYGSNHHFSTGRRGKRGRGGMLHQPGEGSKVGLLSQKGVNTRLTSFPRKRHGFMMSSVTEQLYVSV